jgi:hypothetical protein
MLTLYNRNMKLFIIVLLVNLVCLFGDKLGYKMTKTQLRGMYKKELERIMQGWFTDSFNNVFDDIIATAKQGKHEYRFNVVCSECTNHNCNRVDGMYLTLRIPQITPSNVNINTTNYVTNLMDKLHETFPDSNFTMVQNNYCEHHKIEW